MVESVGRVVYDASNVSLGQSLSSEDKVDGISAPWPMACGIPREEVCEAEIVGKLEERLSFPSTS